MRSWSRAGCAAGITTCRGLSAATRQRSRRTPRPRTQAFVAAGGTTVAGAPQRRAPALVVDGLFGIGSTRPARRRYAGLVAVGQRCRRADPRTRHSDRPRRRHRHGARADDPRDGDRHVHRAEARAADRGRTRLLRRHFGPSLGIDAAARAHAAIGCDWPALAAALPAVLASPHAQRQQGHVRHAGHPGRHRRHGRRADPRRPRGAAHRRRQGLARAS